MADDSAAAPAPLERRPGEAPIKREFLKPIAAPPQDAGENRDGSAAPPQGKRSRGTFKKRPHDAAADPADGLCRPVASGNTCPFGDSCKFSHDVASFLKRKEKDLGDECPVFSALGFCRDGFACRFARAHVATDPDTGAPRNVDQRSEQQRQQQQQHAETNALTDTLRTQLRKHTYPFRTKPQQQKNNKKHNNKQQKPKAAEVGVDDAATSTADDAAAVDDAATAADVATSTAASATVDDAAETSETPLSFKERKPIDFKRKIYVAPLTTVGNLPFRRLCKQLGADITCGEMALASNLLQAQQSEWALLRRHASEDLFGVQLAGAHGDQLARVCELLARETDVDFVDINMGCPIDMVCKAGAGAALMTRPPRLLDVISGALTGLQLGAITQIPNLTVKLRTGWSDKQPVAHKLLPKIQAARASPLYVGGAQQYALNGDFGVAAVTIHGRSRLQRYTKYADWDYVFECQAAQDPELPSLPIVGGGDVLSFQEFDDHLKNGKLATCMIARGALIKPWLCTEIKEQRHWDISAGERLDLLKDFVKFGLEHWGSDQKGVNRTRRYLLEWQSFLCRYIPVGLLEVVPQTINSRPQPYYGRSELETLLASDQAVDWIKISEMLLGKVPDGFEFQPKHKANAYNG